jgi:branched-chain amino acid transport system ATP-binding protein
MTTLTGTELGVHYGAFRALDGVGIHLRPGHITGLIGPNGSGKSTLLHTLAGFLRPTTGRVVLGDIDVTALEPYRRARLGLSIKFQVARIYTQLTVAENILLALQAGRPTRRLLRSADDRSDLARARELLAPFQLDGVLEMIAGELGHGHQQRLELAMVAAHDPKVLLLDEPTAGMSPDERRAVGQWMTSFADRCAVLIVDHDLDFVRSISNTITVLNQGRHIATGTPTEIESNPDVRRVYLSHV